MYINEHPKIRNLLKPAIRAGLTPGAIAVVSTPDQCSCTRAGNARLFPSPRFVTKNTVYDLASLTKVLATTSLFLIALRSKNLSLETGVGDILPDARGSRWEGVRIEHLLSHTSGLPAWVPLYALAEGDNTRVLESLLNLEFEASPGQRVVYSCLGFILLGIILETVLELPLNVAFQTLVAKPLGIEHDLGYHDAIISNDRAGHACSTRLESTMVKNLGLDPRHVPQAMPHLPDDGNARFLGGFSGNAGLFGTAEAVLTLARNFLPTKVSFFSRSEMLMVSHDRTLGLGANRGIGWQLATSPGCSAGPSLSRSSFGHTGFTGTSLWIDPDREMICILLSNRQHPEHRLINFHPLRRRFHAIAVTTT